MSAPSQPRLAQAATLMRQANTHNRAGCGPQGLHAERESPAGNASGPAGLRLQHISSVGLTVKGALGQHLGRRQRRIRPQVRTAVQEHIWHLALAGLEGGRRQCARASRMKEHGAGPAVEQAGPPSWGHQAGHLTRPGNQATSPAMPPGSSLSTCCTCPLSEHATWALMTSVGEGAVPAGATGAQPLSPMAGRTRRAGVRRPAGRPRT